MESNTKTLNEVLVLTKYPLRVVNVNPDNPMVWEELLELNNNYCNWDWFFKSEDVDNFNLGDIPFPDMTKLEYGCYSYFTEEEPDKRYTYNKDTGDFTKDDNGDYLVFETEIRKGSSWFELIVKVTELMSRVKDWQHRGINSFDKKENGVYELTVDS
jgi:hypothetical protein